MRGDLPRGLQAAYIAHAAGESNPRNWKDMHVVVLVAKDSKVLSRVKERLVLACVPHHPMRETDGEFAGQVLSLGVEPCRKEFARRVLSSLPLLR